MTIDSRSRASTRADMLAACLAADARPPGRRRRHRRGSRTWPRCRASTPMPLIGYGLVVGLNKTGDRRQTIFSAQTLANMLERFGVLVPGEQMKIENIAAVLVTAELPPYVRRGARLDVTARRSATRAACRAARCSPRRCAAPTGRSTRWPRARCRSAASAAAAAATRSRSTTSRSAACRPAASSRPRRPTGPAAAAEEIVLALNAARLHQRHAAGRRDQRRARAGHRQGARSGERRRARARRVPRLAGQLSWRGSSRCRSTLDAPARVVINERTGTVVVGSHVRLGAAAVAHGNLSVQDHHQVRRVAAGALLRDGRDRRRAATRTSM